MDIQYSVVQCIDCRAFLSLGSLCYECDLTYEEQIAADENERHNQERLEDMEFEDGNYI